MPGDPAWRDRPVFLFIPIPYSDSACGSSANSANARPHPGAVVPIGRKQPLGLWRKLRAAAVPPARHRDEQRKAQLTLRLLYDGPRLGIGHAHGHGRAPQGMRLAHMAQELRNTGAEAFCFPKDPDADNRP